MQFYKHYQNVVLVHVNDHVLAKLQLSDPREKSLVTKGGQNEVAAKNKAKHTVGGVCPDLLFGFIYI